MRTSCNRTQAAGALLLLTFYVAAGLTTSFAQVFRQTSASTPRAATPPHPQVLPVLDERFLSNLPRNFVLPAFGDRLGARLLAEYGAVLVAGNGVTVPPSSIFSSEAEAAGFQSGLRISGGKYRLQAVAAETLAAAQAEAQRHGRRISPADADAAGRSYAHTVTLWKSRVEPALQYWTRQGRLHTRIAIDIRSLTPPQQTLAIIRLEQQGMFFGTGFVKSILSCVSPPGTSQHLALLAFDVKEHWDPMVRTILERHGWYQTIVRDAPHFTYLGVSKSRLPSLGLMVVRDGDREYWIPRVASLSPTATNAPHIYGRGGLWPQSQRHDADLG